MNEFFIKELNLTYTLVDILDDGDDSVFLFILQKTVNVSVVDRIQSLESFSRVKRLQVLANFWNVDAFRSKENISEVELIKIMNCIQECLSTYA